MTPQLPKAPSLRLGASDFRLAIVFIATLLFFAAIGVISYRNSTFLADDAKQVAHTHEVITSLERVLSLVKDAETGQRGYLLTGDDHYLTPFNDAQEQIAGQIARASGLISDNPDQVLLLGSVKESVAAKFAELNETITIRRTRGLDAAMEVVRSDRGKSAMDALRNKIQSMVDVEKALRQARLTRMHQAYRTAVTSGILAAVLGMLLAGVAATLVRRSLATRRRQDWLQAGRLGLASQLVGEQNMQELGINVLSFLVKYFDAHAGALFIRKGNEFRRMATFGIPIESRTPERFQLGDGLLGEAARTDTPLIVNDVPDGYLTIASGLGRSNPRFLVLSSVKSDHRINGVIELGFIHPMDALALELLKDVSDMIGVAIKSAEYRENLQELLEETQRQGEELQTQTEELRVSNEELEEQSRALRESQTRLELQQAELEQTNSQLEEQAQLLEGQRDDLSQANAAVQAKAEELERASRYKSDFLANMSHELRTPLNSSLILSKLLADNPEGNLSPEQVKYAETIQSSGNDLLVLINDILDLSKIEAGHMEVHPEPTAIKRLVSDLARIFEPVAKQKTLNFSTEIAANCPELLETDRQRLLQILKNLLSNAFKFTEQGGVELKISRSSAGPLEFSVSDTGIGISDAQQRDIFDAFRQADGTISRKYGGTGLGLSISRELTRILGGTLHLHSAANQGSTFTVIIPEKFTGTLPASPIQLPVEPSQSPSNRAKPAVIKSQLFDDDREKLVATSRVILVVEDDASFAGLLAEMVHEVKFECLVAATAEEALVLARQYLPNAILLDVGLPDNSGLSVLDRLKQDTRTRHIPIHVVSAGDHSRTALSLGAVGYLLKPVKREDLLNALRQIETRFSNAMRHVLIVEDDQVQRESLMKLLGSREVETTAVGTAAECLERLKESTFDCMVLDLSLPDASGYFLLETLSKEDTYSFPPVIVYTGRDLSRVDEEKLRRYSKSIIIKGAKSPERLLDEVTLFLHHVVSDLPEEQQHLLKKAQNRDAILEGRRILIVEDDVRNIYSLTNILEPRGALVQLARNGREALDALAKSKASPDLRVDLVLMDVMMPEMDGMTATREIRKQSEWKKLPIIMLTAKAMKNDQERCLEAGANDYMAKPIDVEKLLSLVRVWMPR